MTPIKKTLMATMLAALGTQAPAGVTTQPPYWENRSTAPAMLEYIVKGVQADRPVQVFALDGNLYLQFPDGVTVKQADSLSGNGKLSHYLSSPYVVVENAAAGALVTTTHGVLRIMPRGMKQMPTVVAKKAPVKKPVKASSSIKKTKTPTRLTTAQLSKEIQQLNKKTEQLLSRARKLSVAKSHSEAKALPMLAHKAKLVGKNSVHSLKPAVTAVHRAAVTPKAIKAAVNPQPKPARSVSRPVRRPAALPRYGIHWTLDKGRLSDLLRSRLKEKQHTLIWKTSVDFEVPVPVGINGTNLADALNKVSHLYGLPIALCRGNNTVVVYTPGTPRSYMQCSGSVTPATQAEKAPATRSAVKRSMTSASPRTERRAKPNTTLQLLDEI